jgi:hypothetical protein
MDTNMKCVRCKFKPKIGVEQTKGHIIPYLYNVGDPIQAKTFQNILKHFKLTQNFRWSYKSNCNIYFLLSSCKSILFLQIFCFW